EKFDVLRRPLHRIAVKRGIDRLAGGQRELRRDAVRSAVTGAMQGAVNRRWLADILHNVNLAALRPAYGAGIVAQQPEGGPYSLSQRQLDARLEASISL